MEVGENLSSYPFIITLSADSAEGVDKQMQQIRIPYRILCAYGLDGKHYRTLATSRLVKIKEIKKEN